MAKPAFEVRGTDDLAKLGRAFKAAGSGGKGMRKELRSGLTRATKETRRDLKAAIPDALPRRGGLAALVARTATVTTSSSTSGPKVGVRIKARRRGLKGPSLRRLNAGTVRHPVYGNPKKWVSQTAGVKRGFLTLAFARSKPKVRREVADVIKTVRSRIYRRV